MINILKQDSQAIIKFDSENFDATLEIVRVTEGRKYNNLLKNWSIPLEKLEEFCSALDLQSIPFEITSDLKPTCAKQLQFSPKENKQERQLVYLRIQDQPVFCIRMRQGFIARARLEPFTSSIKGDNLIFPADNLWDVLQECKREGAKVIM